MDFDYNKAEQDFLEQLKNREFSVEILENNGPDRKTREADDLAAFTTYMASEDYQLFCKEVSEK